MHIHENTLELERTARLLWYEVIYKGGILLWYCIGCGIVGCLLLF